jgi:hypothetical protein
MKKILLSVALSLVAGTASAHTATELTFMEGRWQGKYNDLEVVSHYIAGNWQVFVGRTFMKDADGKTQFAELMRVEAHEGNLTLTPFPQGKQGVPFQLTEITPTSVTFENPNHPFPSKIQYTVVGDILFTSVTGTENGKPKQIAYKQKKIPGVIVDF